MVERLIDVVLVVAIAENGVIGRGNALPWRLKSDMIHFRSVTMGKPVVMGRKTFLSIGKPLKGRTTIVVSRDPDFAAPGVLVASTLNAALTAARGDALRCGVNDIIVAGGGEIYAQALPVASQLVVTEVHKKVEGDARFPAIDPQLWGETERRAQQPGAEDDAPFAFVTYVRLSKV